MKRSEMESQRLSITAPPHPPLPSEQVSRGSVDPLTDESITRQRGRMSRQHGHKTQSLTSSHGINMPLHSGEEEEGGGSGCCWELMLPCTSSSRPNRFELSDFFFNTMVLIFAEFSFDFDQCDKIFEPF